MRACAGLCMFAHRLVHGNPSARLQNPCVHVHAHVKDCVGFRSAHVHMRFALFVRAITCVVGFMFTACVVYMILVLSDGKS